MTGASANQAASQSPVSLVFIDSAFTDLDALTKGLSGDHELVLLHRDQSGLQQINRVLRSRANVSSIHLVAHGQSGQLQLGNQTLDVESVYHYQSEIRGRSRSLAADADILIYGCETGAGEAGLQLIETLARFTKADVTASTDKTGASQQDGDWDLERYVGTIDAELAFDRTTMERYRAVLPISIRASGSTGEEQMLLQVDGVTVATFDNVDTIEQDYVFDLDGINADQIRVAFSNDLYDPDNGIDRNLNVDSITVDGVTYETEAPEVFSTGTWLPEDGIVAGFRESETLHTD